MPPEEDQARAIGNMPKNWWGLAVWFSSYASRQTDKPTNSSQSFAPLPEKDQDCQWPVTRETCEVQGTSMRQPTNSCRVHPESSHDCWCLP